MSEEGGGVAPKREAAKWDRIRAEFDQTQAPAKSAARDGGAASSSDKLGKVKPEKPGSVPTAPTDRQLSHAGQMSMGPELVWFDSRSIYAAMAQCLALPPSVLVSSFFINVLGLALPLAILQVYDRILPNRALDTLTMLVIGLAVVVILESAMKIARSHVMSWAALKAGYAADVDAVGRFLGARSAEVSKDGAAVWIDRLDALTQLNSFYGGPARLILLDLPFVAIFFVFILMVGGPMVLVPIVVIACFAGHTAQRGKKLQELLAERSKHDSRRYDFIVECLKGIHAVKSMAMEPAMQRRFERLQRASAEISYKLIIESSAMQASGALFANVSMVAMVTVGALAVMNGYLSVGALACCSLLSGRVVQPVLKGISVWSELQNVQICRKRAAPLFRLGPRKPIVQDELEIKGAVTFKDLFLKRRDDTGVLFNGLSLTIEPGEFVGFRGSDGSGRTTLLNAVRGEVLNDSGMVYVDGLNVSGPAQPQVAESICYVGAGVPIFRGSVIENITMFRKGEVLERARQSAQLIGLEDDIHSLPEGYDTIIGEGVADTLPGGLQQRIAIARALVCAPRILLFDEANSLVDFDSDQKLREGLLKLKGHMTILVASNRPSFLGTCDRVFELRGGRLERVRPNGDAFSPSLDGRLQRAGDASFDRVGGGCS